MALSRASLAAVILAAACAPSTFDARLRQGDVEGALAAFHAEAEIQRKPEAVLQAALLLRERGMPGDADASRGLLETLVREWPEVPSARTAGALLRFDAELGAARDSLAALGSRVSAMETEVAARRADLRRLEQEMMLRDSLVNLLTRTAGRLEAELEAERSAFEQLRRTLEQLMEVDLDRPPVPAAPDVPPVLDGR